METLESTSQPAEVAASPQPLDLGRIAVWVLFFFSGACGLIYEVLWCRHLGLIFGNTTQSLSAVLTAFMGGLALGSFVGGRFSQRLKNPLLAYGVIEIGIGLYCAFLPSMFSDTAPIIPLYRSMYGETGSSSLAVARFLLSFLLLLIPTTLMGATLPILSQFVVRSRESLGKNAGTLYALNTFGAVLGAAAAGFVLLPMLGKSGTNWAAVLMNIVLGVVAIFLGQQQAPIDPSVEEKPSGAFEGTPAEDSTDKSASIMKWVILIFGITGFAALSTQIGWTRAIALGTGSSTYSFSLIVSIFILGLAAGGIWGARVAVRAENPALFLAKVLLGIGMFSMMLTVVLGLGPKLFFILLAWGKDRSWTTLLVFQAIGIAALIFIPTFLMGATMPLTMQIASRSSRSAGRTVGTIYAVNTLGSILGSSLGGLILLPLIGIQLSLQVSALMYAIPGIGLYLMCSKGTDEERSKWFVIALAPILIAVIVAPITKWDPMSMNAGYFLLRDAKMVQRAKDMEIATILGTVRTDSVLYYKEGADTTVTVTEVGDRRVLRVGGKPDATSHGDMSTQLGLTMLPMMLHQTGAEEVLVIGLGSGASAGAALTPETVKRVDVVEMSPEVVEASWHFRKYNNLTYADDEKLSPLNTPKLSMLINDGRNHLLLTSRKYDVIASEPSNPWLAGVGNLFTFEAFSLAKAHLKTNGIMSQWIHTYSLDESSVFSILRTFADVFPNVQIWCVNSGDLILLGSETPIAIPYKTLNDRLQSPASNKLLLKNAHFDTVPEFIACFLIGNDVARNHVGQLNPDRTRRFPLHTDNNMLLEFSAPRALYRRDGQLKVTQFFADAETVLKLESLKPAERALIARDVDVAVAAREHWEYSIEDPNLREEHMELAHKLAPHQLWAALHIRENEKGRAAKALTAPEEPIKAAPAPAPSGPKALEEAESLLKENKSADAIAKLKKFDPQAKEPRAQLLLGRAYGMNGDVNTALQTLGNAAKIGAPVVECTEHATRLLYDAGRLDEAVVMMNGVLTIKAAHTDPKTAKLWSLGARVLIARNAPGDLPNAEVLSNNALGLDKSSVEFLKTHVEVMRAGRLFNVAYQELRVSASMNPWDLELRMLLADTLVKYATTFQPGEGPSSRTIRLLRYARRTANEVLAQDSKSQGAWLALCRAHLGLRDQDPESAAFHLSEARYAFDEAMEAARGDVDKIPDDLLQLFGQ